MYHHMYVHQSLVTILKVMLFQLALSWFSGSQFMKLCHYDKLEIK